MIKKQMDNHHWVKSILIIDRAIDIMKRLLIWAKQDEGRTWGAKKIFDDIERFVDDYTPLTKERIAEKRKKLSETKF
jgi:hypothetical protein